MRIVLILLTFLFFATPVSTAYADVESAFRSLFEDRRAKAWEQEIARQPYLENTKHPHPTQWAGYGWYAEDWIAQSANGLSLVQGFYDAHILHDQLVTEEGQPILVVGPNFYRLSGLDKRRVATTIDTVYGVTKNRSDRVIILKDWHTELPIGLYNEYGLQIQ